MNPRAASSAQAIALLVFVSFAWGFAWPMSKVALGAVPVWHLRAGTTVLGGCLMLALARMFGNAVALPRRELMALALLAQFNVTGWGLLSAYGVSLMDAGRAGIIAFTMPIWAAALSAAMGQERMTSAKLTALAMGIAGLAALLAPDWRHILASPLGVLAMLGSAISWAVGTVGMKQLSWSASAAVQSGWQLLFGGLVIALGLPFVGERFDPAGVEVRGWIAVAYVFLIAMLLAQWAWFAAVHALSATVAAIGSLMVPVVGVIAGALWLGEEVGFGEILALALIGASVLLVMRPSHGRRAATPRLDRAAPAVRRLG